MDRDPLALPDGVLTIDGEVYRPPTRPERQKNELRGIAPELLPSSIKRVKPDYYRNESDRSIQRRSNESINGELKGTLKDAIWDVIKHQFRADPTSVSDGRAIPFTPKPTIPPWGDRPKRADTICEIGLDDTRVAAIRGSHGGRANSTVKVEIWDITDNCGNHVHTEEVIYVDGETAHRFMNIYNQPYGGSEAWWIGGSNRDRVVSRKRVSQISGSIPVTGVGFIGEGDSLQYLYEPGSGLGTASSTTNQHFTYIPSLGTWWVGNVKNGMQGHKTGRNDQQWKSELGTRYGTYSIDIGLLGPSLGTVNGDFTDQSATDFLNNTMSATLGCWATSLFVRLRCSVSSTEEQDGLKDSPPDDYDFDVDEDTDMGCKWQKDEIAYALPELKIGDAKIGGNSIQIDDGLIPLADFLVKAVEMMHRGLGLQDLDTAEFDNVLGDPSKGKLKPASLSELVHWQFENVSNLVGLPSSQEIVDIDNNKKDFMFRNLQDAITFLFHQQKESDMDLKIIETYSAKTAQQLEAMMQTILRQSADIEMLVQELGIKFRWEKRERPSLYKHGMSDEDEKTGILELFKGGKVTYPVRVWDDKLDSRQIAMRTNLYAEMAATGASFVRMNDKDPLPGLDARKQMKKGDEGWREWVKGVNTPEKGTIAGVSPPLIEEYTQGALEAKTIPAPTSGLSMFMKPKKSTK